MSAAIELEDIDFAYGPTRVLHGVGLLVAQGEIFGLVGADGAGKTTLLRLAAGQLQAAGGRREVLGRDPAAPGLRAEIAYMPQGFGLYLDLSVLENLALFADLHGLDRAAAQARIAELLKRTGLKGFEARRAQHLSGGMMQKLALGCALVSRPRVMFLDEPTTGVDPVSRRAFWELLEGVRGEGVAILYATANMDEAERCDRVGYLEDGRITRQGTPEELVAAQEGTLASVTGADARARRAALRALPGVRLVFAVGARLHVWLDPGARYPDFAAAVAALSPELSVEPVMPTLQDAMVRALTLAGQADAA